MTKHKPRNKNLYSIDFTLLESCPKCGTNWHDKPIPKDQQHHFGGAKWFSRVIGIYGVREDRTIAWQCPDCHACWDRTTNKLRESFADVTAYLEKQKAMEKKSKK